MSENGARRRDVSSLILDSLASVGVKQIFGIPGDAINGLVDAIRRQDAIEFITVRHEEAGAFAASAQAKLTGNLGVVVGTAGPGAIHLLNGLYDAKLDGAPVLAITGQVDTPFLGSDYHQEIDLEDLFRDVADFSEVLVNPAQMPSLIQSAIRSAVVNKSVSHLVLPADLALAHVNVSSSQLVLPRPPISRPSDHDLAATASAVNDSDFPTLLVGIGAREAVEETVEVAEKISAPIVTTLRAKQLISPHHPLCVGGLGLLGSKAAVEAVERSDLLFMIGTDFPYQDFYPKRATGIQIDIDPSRIGRRFPVEFGLVGDAGETLKGLAPLLRRVSARRHLDVAQKASARWDERMKRPETDDSTPIRPQLVAASISAQTKPGTIFLCDTGAVTVWAARHLDLKPGDEFTLSSGLASMGFALPAAIGAQLKFPARDVVALAGDGGFSMMLGDLMTAVSLKLPINIVVFNNSKLGLIQMEQEVDGLPEFATALDNPNFADVAHAMGADSWRVEDPERLIPVLAEALKSPKPSVVDVVINPEEITMPPKVTLDQATGYAKAKLKETIGFGSKDPGLMAIQDPLRRTRELL